MQLPDRASVFLPVKWYGIHTHRHIPRLLELLAGANGQLCTGWRTLRIGVDTSFSKFGIDISAPSEDKNGWNAARDDVISESTINLFDDNS
ncbi:hypothetical protein FRC20_008748 [Serendipita sp. 405]|nr:hypothetical protein FRC20_008748 [Serendipita sp. 405]